MENNESSLTLINEIWGLLMSEDEVLIIFGILIAIIGLLTYYLPKIVFYFYENNVVPEVQQIVIEIIYKLDEYADDMENKEKRATVVEKMHQLVRFGNVAIPKSICGLIVDIQVARIRALQKECSKESDLHKKED